MTASKIYALEAERMDGKRRGVVLALLCGEEGGVTLSGGTLTVAENSESVESLERVATSCLVFPINSVSSATYPLLFSEIGSMETTVRACASIVTRYVRSRGVPPIGNIPPASNTYSPAAVRSAEITYGYSCGRVATIGTATISASANAALAARIDHFITCGARLPAFVICPNRTGKIYLSINGTNRFMIKIASDVPSGYTP